MKGKTHSGAKKRLRAKPSGKVKRSQTHMRHLLEHKASKNKRKNGQMAYVHSANSYQVSRLLVL